MIRQTINQTNKQTEITTVDKDTRFQQYLLNLYQILKVKDTAVNYTLQ